MVDTGGVPCIPVQIMTISYTIIHETGVFKKVCHRRRKTSPGHKTWAQLKNDIVAAYAKMAEDFEKVQWRVIFGHIIPIYLSCSKQLKLYQI